MDFSLISSSNHSIAKSIYTGALAHKKTIATAKSSALKDILNALMEQNPELLNVLGFNYAVSLFDNQVSPIYCYPKDVADNYYSECDSEANEIAERIRRYKLSPYEAALHVHDYLSKKVKYELTNDNINHSIIGPLVYDKGCCEGISKSYKFILDKLRIPCLCISGDADDQVNGTTGPHMWNLICIDGEWCHVDVTYDLADKSVNMVSHAYFGLNDYDISVTHRAQSRIYPSAAAESLEYFGRKKKKLGSEAELNQYLSEYFASNILCFELSFSEIMRSKDLQNIVQESIFSCFSSMNKAIHCQMVFAPDRLAFSVRVSIS